MDIIFTPFLFSIIAFQVDFFHLTHKRISWVSSCTLVVECLLGHLVERVEEVLLVDTVVGDGLLDADEVLELLELRDEVLEGLLVVLAPDAAVLGHLGVVVQRVGVRILGEGAHLDGSLGGVVAHDAGQDDGVGDAVGQVMESAELVGHGVADT